MENKTAEERQWKVFSYTAPLGDTGDYDSMCGITNDYFSLYCDKPDDIENDELQEICDTLNAAQSTQQASAGVLRPEHKCVKIAQARMSEGRDWWLGKLIEQVAEFPQETHCLHLKTPLKDVVFLCNSGDFQQLSVLCRHALGYPISESWMQAQLRITNKTDECIPKSQTHIPSAGWSEEEIKRLAKVQYGDDPNLYGGQRDGFVIGFKAALQSSQGKWSDEDMCNAYTAGQMGGIYFLDWLANYKKSSHIPENKLKEAIENSGLTNEDFEGFDENP